MQGTSPAWCWHARYGHQNFCGLRHLEEGNMVSGQLVINHVEQVCEAEACQVS
jgi:hypothetical protein